MNIAICDDDKDITEKLEHLICTKFPYETIDVYASGEELVHSQDKYDIIFLDIEMGQMSGIEAATQLRKKHPIVTEPPFIIFITAHPNYMPDAFDVHAFQYLTKPLAKERFWEVLGKAVAHLKLLDENNRMLRIKTVNGRRELLPVRRIKYLEVMNRIIVIHTLDSEYSCYGQLTQMEELLDERFFRCHRYFLVNLNMISCIHNQQLEFLDGEQIFVSVRKKPKIMKALMQYEQGDTNVQ